MPEIVDPGKAERRSRGIPVVPVFDGFRAYAIAGVVLYHLLAQSGMLIAGGDGFATKLILGTVPWSITVLFVVSGFVLFLPVAARGGEFGSVGSYAVRRIARVAPALWLCLVIVLALLALAPGLPLGFPGIGEIAANFTGQQAWQSLFDVSKVSGFGADAPLWSLTVEVGFYLILPLIAGAYFRHPIWGLGIAAVIAVGWREGFAHIFDLAKFAGIPLSFERGLELQFSTNQLPHWTYSIATGMTGAWAYVRLLNAPDPERVRRVAKRVMAGAIAALALCTYFAGSYAVGFPRDSVLHFVWSSSVLVIVYSTVLAVLFVAMALAGGPVSSPFTHPRARAFGDISYGTYAIHGVLLWLIASTITLPEGSAIRSFLILAAAVVPLAVIYGYGTARWFEQPVRRWAHHRSRQSPQADARRRAVTAGPAGPA